MGLRKWVKKTSKKAKKETEKAVKQVESTAKTAVKTVDSTAKNVGREIDNLANQAERLGMSVLDDIKGLANKAKRDVEGVATQAKKEIIGTANNAKRDVESGLKNVGKDIEGGLQKAGEEIKDELQRTVLALGEALTREALKKVRAIAIATHGELAKLEKSKPQLVGEINKVSFTAELGPIKAKYNGFYRRAGEISSLLSRPPAFTRTGIHEFLSGVVPSAVNLGISVQLVAVVVGSKEFGIGGSVGDVPGQLAVEILDVILEAAGVPK